MVEWSNVWACCPAQDNGYLCWDSRHLANKPSHFSATLFGSATTCFAIASSRYQYETKSKQKRKENSDDSALRASSSAGDMLAVGCADGGIRICSLAVGKLLSTLDEEVSSPVTSLSWMSQSAGLVAGHENGQVVVWDLQSNSVKWKWKADKAAISSLAVGAHDSLVLTGSSVIKCWNMETQECLKKFSGHATTVKHLQFITSPGDYFISYDQLDRVVTAWNLDLKELKRKVVRSVVSFSCSDVPVHVAVDSALLQGQPVQMAICTKSGDVHVFRARLNGHSAKPVQPILTCSVRSTADPPESLPVLCSQFDTGVDGAQSNSGLRIMYGSYARPMFELVEVKESPKPLILTRKDPIKVPISITENVDRTKVPVINKDVSYLTPEHLLPSTSTTVQPPSAKKRRKEELSMEDRLKEVAVREAQDGSSEVSSDALAILLTQGLHSGDSKIVNQVLDHSNDQLVQETVKQLPVLSVIPLIKEISKTLTIRRDLSACLKWLQAVLSNHLSYLSSHPEIMVVLNSQYEMMTARLNLMDKVLRLEGRLHLLVEQAEAKSTKSKFSNQEPKLIFDEDSSGDELEEMSAASAASQPWDELDQMSDVSDDDAAGRMEEGGSEEEEGIAGESSGEESEDASVDGKLQELTEGRLGDGESSGEEEDDQSEEISEDEDDDQEDEDEESESVPTGAAAARRKGGQRNELAGRGGKRGGIVEEEEDDDDDDEMG